jgi:uncharacterized protein
MPEWLYISLVILIQLILLVGLIGSLIPFFPGPVIMWLATLGYGFLAGWNPIGIFLFVLISLLTLLSVVIDNVLMGVGAVKGGATWTTTLLGLVTGVAGTILFPPFGGLIAAPLSILLLEYYRLRDWNKAGKALLGLITGYGLSYIARFFIGLGVIFLWWVWLWKG